VRSSFVFIKVSAGPLCDPDVARRTLAEPDDKSNGEFHYGAARYRWLLNKLPGGRVRLSRRAPVSTDQLIRHELDARAELENAGVASYNAIRAIDARAAIIASALIAGPASAGLHDSEPEPSAFAALIASRQVPPGQGCNEGETASLQAITV
jgi:hypothetical protein